MAGTFSRSILTIDPHQCLIGSCCPHFRMEASVQASVQKRACLLESASSLGEVFLLGFQKVLPFVSGIPTFPRCNGDALPWTQLVLLDRNPLYHPCIPSLYTIPLIPSLTLYCLPLLFHALSRQSTPLRQTVVIASPRLCLLCPCPLPLAPCSFLPLFPSTTFVLPPPARQFPPVPFSLCCVTLLFPPLPQYCYHAPSIFPLSLSAGMNPIIWRLAKQEWFGPSESLMAPKPNNFVFTGPGELSAYNTFSEDSFNEYGRASRTEWRPT